MEPGSGERGRVAVAGHTPLGYYKDPEKSAATFVTIDGVRYSIPGDYATVEADGTIKLLGRGSVCINTGGEKVFPEEVEEVLKPHATVRRRRGGRRARREVRRGHHRAWWSRAAAPPSTRPTLIAHVKGHLAHYKAPKRVLAIDTIGRAPNGKVDYKRLKRQRAGQLGITD